MSWFVFLFCLDNPDIVVPGSGVVISAVASAAQRDPDIMCGKPGGFMFQCIKVSATSYTKPLI